MAVPRVIYSRAANLRLESDAMTAELAFHTISTRHLPELGELLAGAGGNGAPLPPAKARRLYFGSEFCAHLLPSPPDLDVALRTAADHGLPLTLVTPYGGDRLLDRIGKLVERLPEGSEVVANDWGALRRIAREGRCVPIMGRMLSKVMRDPVVRQEWARASEAVPSTTLRLPELLMESLGVRRAETDALPGGDFPPIESNGFDLSVYLPWSPLGSGRVCFAGSFGLGRSPRFGVMEECTRPCRDVHMKLNDPATPESPDVAETYLAGNTMLYRHPEESVQRTVEALPAAVTRLVWEPWIPA
jgi:hypothetical protein